MNRLDAIPARMPSTGSSLGKAVGALETTPEPSERWRRDREFEMEIVERRDIGAEPSELSNTSNADCPTPSATHGACSLATGAEVLTLVGPSDVFLVEFKPVSSNPNCKARKRLLLMMQLFSELFERLAAAADAETARFLERVRGSTGGDFARLEKAATSLLLPMAELLGRVAAERLLRQRRTSGEANEMQPAT